MSSRFEMNNIMDKAPGIHGYKLSNQSPLLVACCRASLDIFDRATMKKLRGKSVVLTGYARAYCVTFVVIVVFIGSQQVKRLSDCLKRVVASPW